MPAGGAQSERFRMGSHVSGTDGDCGELVRVVIDPVAQVLTHLVVKPRHHRAFDKLVKVGLVESTHDDHVHLRCTVAQFEDLDDAEDVQFLPGNTDILGYGTHAVLWPYYSFADSPRKEHHGAIYSDRIPLGDVEVNRGDEVHATDGLIGSVQGLVIDPADGHVTHVLLQEGHVWGRKQVAIPIGTCARVGDEIQVNLSKQQVQELPPVELG